MVGWNSFPLISDNLAIGYGLLIFLGFASLAVWQGLSEYCWQTLGYKVQHDIRMDATHSLIRMEASYYDLRQTGVLMSVLSADVNQLEDVISDSSTSIIRIIVTFLTAGLLLILMSWKLAAVLFGPMVLIFQWFTFFYSSQRKYRKQRESTGGISAVLENVISGISVVQATMLRNGNRIEWPLRVLMIETRRSVPAKIAIGSSPESMLSQDWRLVCWSALEVGSCRTVKSLRVVL